MSISQTEWVRLAREVIVSTLFEKSGLQLKLTLSGQGDKVRGRKDRNKDITHELSRSQLLSRPRSVYLPPFTSLRTSLLSPPDSTSHNEAIFAGYAVQTSFKRPARSSRRGCCMPLGFEAFGCLLPSLTTHVLPQAYTACSLILAIRR